MCRTQIFGTEVDAVTELPLYNPYIAFIHPLASGGSGLGVVNVVLESWVWEPLLPRLSLEDKGRNGVGEALMGMATHSDGAIGPAWHLFAVSLI